MTKKYPCFNTQCVAIVLNKCCRSLYPHFLSTYLRKSEIIYLILGEKNFARANVLPHFLPSKKNRKKQRAKGTSKKKIVSHRLSLPLGEKSNQIPKKRKFQNFKNKKISQKKKFAFFFFLSLCGFLFRRSRIFSMVKTFHFTLYRVIYFS